MRPAFPKRPSTFVKPLAFTAARCASFVAVLALMGCAASRSSDLRGPAPKQALEILAASRSPNFARVSIALAEPAHVTVFSVVPGDFVRLLRAPHDTAMEIAPTLDAGRHELTLVAVEGVEAAAPVPRAGPFFEDPTSYEHCLAQVIARTANQSMQERATALENPYYWCPEWPALRTAPARLPAYVLVVTTAGAPDAARLVSQLGDLDLSGPIASLSDRVGAIVARSADGGVSPVLASATSRW